MSPRAVAMSVEDRRASIVSAVLPLVRASGTLPSTREIAEASGVAEGTIFRAFEDKRALMHALAEHAMTGHAGPALLEVARAEPDLRSRVTVVAAQLQDRVRTIGEVLMALRPLMQAEREQPAGPPEFVVRANRELLERLTEVFEIDRADLRVDPATAALVLRSVVLGSQHPGMSATPGLSAEQVADVIVSGIARAHPQESPC